MKSGDIKEVFVELMEIISGIERDDIKLDANLEALEVSTILDRMLFSQIPIDVLDVSLADGAEFSIYGDEFRKSLEKEGTPGATQFVELAIYRARQDMKNRPVFFREGPSSECPVTIGTPNPNN